MAILDLLFPKKCLNCGKSGQYICPKCLGKVRKAYYSCPHCSKASYLGKTHEACKSKTSLAGKICLWKYEGIVRKSILALKYKFAFDVADELSIACSKELQSINFDIEDVVLVPVPLHLRREYWRGFNQAAAIGERIARDSSWEYENMLIMRTKHSSPQARLKKNERMQNISGKFAVNTELAAKYNDKTIVIFDDVWTTGSTMREIASELKKTGIKQIWGISIAGA